VKLQTKITLEKQENNQIDYHSKLLLLGSCFSENIGKKFNYFKFQNISNPFGILFHPKAIETLVVNALNNKVYKESNVFFNNEQWHCFDAHSRLSNVSKEALLENLNASLSDTKKHLLNASHIVITLGTAWVYKEHETGKEVANCHKVSQKQFDKQLLSIEEIYNSLLHLIQAIQSVNNKASVIFTVSPVRHIKDGFVENTLSKSHLITAIHSILNTQQKHFYFPSYEIMLDELRDYRFYKPDMLHPNDLAVDYIWQKFIETWVSKKAEETMNIVDAVQKGLAHKPFNSNSEAHKIFSEKIEAQKSQLTFNFPFMIFS